MRYLLLVLSLAGCSANNCQSLPNTEITEMYSSYVEEWKEQAQTSFKEAEDKIFIVNPLPPKPDINDGTNPDPAKCICRGTGIIVQGDGHKTACPFHSKSQK